MTFHSKLKSNKKKKKNAGVVFFILSCRPIESHIAVKMLNASFVAERKQIKAKQWCDSRKFYTNTYLEETKKVFIMRVRIEFSIRMSLHTKSSLNVHTDAHKHTFKHDAITTWKIPHAISLFFFFSHMTDERAKQRRKRRTEKIKKKYMRRRHPLSTFFLCVYFIVNSLLKNFVARKKNIFRAIS